MQYDSMKLQGVEHFDAWASTFGQVVTGWELDATGMNYKLNSRFAKFQNVPELIAQYRTFADVVTLADLKQQAIDRGERFPVPNIKGGRAKNIVVPRSPDQAHYIGEQEPVLDADGRPQLREDGSLIKQWPKGCIIERMEHPPSDPRIDNPLKITNDARKAGLDYRLIDPSAPDFAGSKVNIMIDNIVRIHEDWDAKKGTQLVFCDLSTPKGKKGATAIVTPAVTIDDENEIEDEEDTTVSMDEILAGSNRFSVYDDVKQKLIAKGIPEGQIRFIHDAKTDVQKDKLFAQMRAGDVRVLIGSTAKMGAGTNVQNKLVAEHHIDCPWRPSDLEQREGRIIRQGNEFFKAAPDEFEVEIIRYATEKTYDSRMWQTIEYKAAGIEQFRKGIPCCARSRISLARLQTRQK
ncbi:helicase-related protein [Undibacterium arcticum]|uniref:helicase-related protein n=1 Tax=Undibacterium arcticum TaxID=1762892 RepID=UPI0036187283